MNYEFPLKHKIPDLDKLNDESYPIVINRVLSLLDDFLKYKKMYGNNIENLIS